MRNSIILLLIAAIIQACGDGALPYDAYGHFETTEWNIGPEVPGKVIAVYVDEGVKVDSGAVLCQIDTTEWVLNLKKLEAMWQSLNAKLADAGPEISVLEERERVLMRERDRVKNLLAGGAATPKQLDDIDGELQVIKEQKVAAIEKADITNRGILSERQSLEAEMALVRDKIRRCELTSPAEATILVRNVEPGEVAVPGRVFFRMARLDEMILRAYIEGARIGEIRAGQEVQIGVGQGDTIPGTIQWISSEAEFSPKFVETREERADRVYAFKVRVKNTGTIKIGMPGEVYLPEDPKTQDPKNQ